MESFQIDDAEFNLSEVDARIMGAGILPVRVVRDKLQVLLGKERYIPNWRGSHKWSGFEGGRKPGEEIEYNAAREFIEESISSVNLVDCDTTIPSIVEALKAKKYVARIALCILHGHHHDERRYKIMYLMEACGNHDSEACFASRRRTLMRFDNESKFVYDPLTQARIVREYNNLDAACRSAIECDEALTVFRVQDDFLEKQSVQWWWLEELEQVLNNGGCLQTNFFRAYFLPILWRTVRELKRYEAPTGATTGVAPALGTERGGDVSDSTA
jgi:hypothetical protein